MTRQQLIIIGALAVVLLACSFIIAALAAAYFIFGLPIQLP